MYYWTGVGFSNIQILRKMCNWGNPSNPIVIIENMGLVLLRLKVTYVIILKLKGHVVLYDLNSGTYQNCSEKFTILVIPVYQDCFFWQF